MKRERKQRQREKLILWYKLIILYYNNYNCFHCLKYFQNSADESAGEEDEEEKSARLHKIRVEAGKKAAATRKAKEQVSS